MAWAPRPVVRRTVLLAGLGNYTHPTTRHSIGQYVLEPLARCAAAHDVQVRAEVAATMERFRGTPHALPPSELPRAFAMERAAKGWVAKVSVLLDTKPQKGTKFSPLFKAEPARFPLVLADIVLYIPKFLMNVSGAGIAAAQGAYPGVRLPDDVLLLHDEMSRAFGKISFKAGGSAAGHNGVRSAQAMLRTKKVAGDVARIRIGIGRPPEGVDVSPFVLGTMPSDWLDACQWPPPGNASASATPELAGAPPHGELIEQVWKEVMQWCIRPYVP